MALQPTPVTATPTSLPAAKPPAAVPAPAPAAAQPQAAAPSSVGLAQPAPQPVTKGPSLQEVLGRTMSYYQNVGNLQNQKDMLLRHMYDVPMSDADLQKLTPSQQIAVREGNRAAIEYQVSALNNQIRGRSSDISQAVQFAVDGYKTQMADMQNKRVTAQNAINDYINKLGSNMSQVGITEAEIQQFYQTGELPPSMATKLMKAESIQQQKIQEQADRATAAQGLLTMKDVGNFAAMSAAAGKDPNAVFKALAPFVGRSAQEAGKILREIGIDASSIAKPTSGGSTGGGATTYGEKVVIDATPIDRNDKNWTSKTLIDMPPNTTQASVDQAALELALAGKIPSGGLAGKGPSANYKFAVESRAASFAQMAGTTLPDLQRKYKEQVSAGVNLEKYSTMVDQFENTAKKNQELMNKLITGVDDTGSPWLNRYVQDAEKGVFGSPETQAFHAAVKTFAMEYAKIMSGNVGIGGGSVFSQQEAEDMINGYLTKGQFGLLNYVLQTDMANRIEGINEAKKGVDETFVNFYNAVYGTPPTDVQAPRRVDDPKASLNDLGQVYGISKDRITSMIKAGAKAADIRAAIIAGAN